MDAQVFLKCHRCDTSAPEPQPPALPTEAEPVRLIVPAPPRAAAAIGGNEVANLLVALEAFARRNAPPGADVARVVNSMLAAAMRALAEGSER